MVTIAAISDTHNLHHTLNIPECDILIHAGDATGKGTYKECIDFLLWMSSQTQCKHKIFVPGNHDFLFQGEFREHVPGTVNVLIDQAITVQGLKIYGTPWQPFFYDWAFNGLEKRLGYEYNYKGGPGPCSPDHLHPLLSSKFSLIPDDTNIIICHGPPRIGKLDLVSRTQEHVGSVELMKAIKRLPNFLAGFYGHIHSGYGKVVDGKATHYNVSICDKSYAPRNPITLITI